MSGQLQLELLPLIMQERVGVDIRFYLKQLLIFFTRRVRDFEYTTECIIFDLLQIVLYHGWLVDPQNTEEVSAVGKVSYNQLVEKIICLKSSDNPDDVQQGI